MKFIENSISVNMKYYLPIFLFPILLCNCKPKEKKAQELEILDTEMAEIKNSEIATKYDSLKIISVLENIIKAIKINDSVSLINASLKSVYYPNYINKGNYFTGFKIVDITKYQSDSVVFLSLKSCLRECKKDKRHISCQTELTKDFDSLNIDTNSVKKYFIIHVYTTDTIGNYLKSQFHTVKFIETKSVIKFCGISIQENDSRFLYKKFNLDSLYFPLYSKSKGGVVRTKSFDTVTNTYHSEDLANLKEPKLYKSTDFDESIRFTWLRSFDKPITVRIDKKNYDLTLTLKELNFTVPYSPNTFSQNQTKKISIPHWFNILYKLNGLKFWEMDSEDPSKFEVMDGAIFILEVKEKDRYHMIDTKSPSKELRELFYNILDLADYNYKAKY